MKTTLEIPEGFDPSLEAEATLYPDWNGGRTFTITGLGAAVVEAAGTFKISDPVHEASTAKKPAKQAPEVPQAVYTPLTPRQKVGQWLADGKLRRFDREYGTNLYGEKQAQRKREAVFTMAAEAGLFAQDSDYYKAQLRRMLK